MRRPSLRRSRSFKVTDFGRPTNRQPEATSLLVTTYMSTYLSSLQTGADPGEEKIPSSSPASVGLMCSSPTHLSTYSVGFMCTNASKIDMKKCSAFGEGRPSPPSPMHQRLCSWTTLRLRPYRTRFPQLQLL